MDHRRRIFPYYREKNIMSMLWTLETRPIQQKLFQKKLEKCAKMLLVKTHAWKKYV